MVSCVPVNLDMTIYICHRCRVLPPTFYMNKPNRYQRELYIIKRRAESKQVLREEGHHRTTAISTQASRKESILRKNLRLNQLVAATPLTLFHFIRMFSLIKESVLL